MIVIEVKPIQGAWAVSSADMEPMMYTRGEAAERAAHDLGRRLAGHGLPVEVQIYMRDGRPLFSVRLKESDPWSLLRQGAAGRRKSVQSAAA